MMQLICDNSIGYDAKMNLPYRFNFTTDIEITSSWENLTDTCRITVPNKLRLRTRDHTEVITNGTDKLFKRGDPVTLKLGYKYKDPQTNKQVTRLNTIFTGRMVRVYPSRPLIFECEDRMLDMKLISVTNYNIKSLLVGGVTTLDKVIADIFSKANYNPSTVKDVFGNPSPFTIVCEPIQLDSLSFKGTLTLAEILNWFKRDPFHLFCYFKNSYLNGVYQGCTLNIGFPNKLGRLATIPPKGTFDFNHNIIDDDIDFLGSDIKIQVTAINFNRNNTKSAPILVDGATTILNGKTTTIVDLNAEQRTIYTFDLQPSAVLDIANQYVHDFKYTGMRGSFTTFLQPTINHGDVVKLVDTMIPDRNGLYLVKQVVTKFGMDGGRQVIYLDQKVG